SVLADFAAVAVAAPAGAFTAAPLFTTATAADTAVLATPATVAAAGAAHLLLERLDQRLGLLELALVDEVEQLVELGLELVGLIGLAALGHAVDHPLGVLREFLRGLLRLLGLHGAQVGEGHAAAS